MRSLLAGAVALGAAAFLAYAVDGAASPSATRLVDRTLACTTGYHGGARVIFVRAQSAFGEGATLEWLAGAYVSTAGQPLPTKPNYRPTLAGVNAGWPPPPPLTSGGLGFENQRCVPSKARVALSSRGLTGGPAGQLGDEYTCIVPKTVVVRVRARFREPVTLRLTNRQRFYSAAGRIERGQIAVATAAGKPLVYAEVTESGGTSRLFTSRGCA